MEINLTGQQTNEEFYNLFSNDIPMYIILKIIRSQQIHILVDMKVIITHQYSNPHEHGNIRILFFVTLRGIGSRKPQKFSTNWFLNSNQTNLVSMIYDSYFFFKF